MEYGFLPMLNEEKEIKKEVVRKLSAIWIGSLNKRFPLLKISKPSTQVIDCMIIVVEEGFTRRMEKWK